MPVILVYQITYLLCFRRRERVYWECTVRRGRGARCPAMVTEYEGDFTRGRSSHSHEPCAGLSAAIAAKRNVRACARQEMFAPASTVVAEACDGLDDVVHDNMPTVQHMVRCISSSTIDATVYVLIFSSLNGKLFKLYNNARLLCVPVLCHVRGSCGKNVILSYSVFDLSFYRFVFMCVQFYTTCLLCLLCFFCL